jgi:DNA-binding CsgD family transcriptional regulator
MACVEELQPFDLLDAFPAAILLIDENLQFLQGNTSARRRLQSNGDSFARLVGQGSGSSAQEMRRQVKEAVVKGTRATLLLRASSPDALICSLSPVRCSQMPCALVVIAPLVAGSLEVVSHLRRLYRLSNAEAEIAATAATGMDVVQLAVARSVSPHTLRAQIASIKAKMGLSRMSEIAVTVGRIEAAVTWL